jgi:hypothetical protein
LYTNIPIEEIIEVVERKIKDETCLSSTSQQELITLIKLTKKQNYFETDGKYWLQQIGTPMGSPIFRIVAKIFLQ